MAATESSPVFVRVGSGLLVNIKYIMTIATKLRLAQNGTETELEGEIMLTLSNGQTQVVHPPYSDYLLSILKNKFELLEPEIGDK